jgi:hypothetical protein
MLRWILTVPGKQLERIPKFQPRESRLSTTEERFDIGCSKLLDQMKQAKLQWLQHPSEINVDNLNNEISEASRYFRNKTREYLKDKQMIFQ